jgi:hypothetical protein
MKYIKKRFLKKYKINPILNNYLYNCILSGIKKVTSYSGSKDRINVYFNNNCVLTTNFDLKKNNILTMGYIKKYIDREYDEYHWEDSRPDFKLIERFLFALENNSYKL